MPTQTEVESKLRRSLRSVAAVTTVDADWDSFSERLEETEGTLPTLRPIERRSFAARQPVVVLVSAFIVALVSVGLLGVLSKGPAPEVSDSPQPTSLAEQRAACQQDLSCEEAVANSFFVQCMTDAGFTVELAGGVITIGSDDAMEAAQECDKQMSALLPPGPELTPEYLSDYYDFLLEVAECAEGQGHIADEPTSKESFIESRGANWHPYQNLIGPEFAALERACPQDFRG